ncbi:hypothetical protein [Zoogloea sp.]|uniref:hypothetical protein n=1 Tax=Zoogloea sp. TaxID=49181 RepID=UPI0035AEC1E8
MRKSAVAIMLLAASAVFYLDDSGKAGQVQMAAPSLKDAAPRTLGAAGQDKPAALLAMGSLSSANK